MDSPNLDDWLGPNGSSFMPAEPAAPYFPSDAGNATRAPSSSVAERLARKGLSAPSPKSAVLDTGIDDWVVPSAQSTGSAQPAGTFAGKARDPLARDSDGGVDDWILPSTAADQRSLLPEPFTSSNPHSSSDATFLPVAMSCSEAHRACLRMGQGATNCMNAYLNCARGLPTIFGPGIVGFPK